MSASANNVSLLTVLETSFAETPDQTKTFVRSPFTTDSLKPVKETNESETINPDRTASKSLLSFKGVTGSTEHELDLVNFQGLLQSLYQRATPVVTSIAGETAAIANTGQTVTAASGTPFAAFVTGARPRYLRITGAATAANNGVKRLLSATNTVLTFAAGSFTTDEASPSLTFTNTRIENGSDRRSYLVEKQWGDTTDKHHYTGMNIMQGTVSITAREPVTLSLEWTGSRYSVGFGGTDSATAGDGSPTEPTAAPIITASNNVATILKGGSAIGACVKSVELSPNNNMRDEPCVGQLNSVSTPVNGEFQLTGTIELLFEDSDLVKEFDNHTDFELVIPIEDSDGRYYAFVLPRVTLDEADIPTEGRNTSVMQTYSFSTSKGATTDAAFQASIEVLTDI